MVVRSGASSVISFAAASRKAVPLSPQTGLPGFPAMRVRKDFRRRWAEILRQHCFGRIDLICFLFNVTEPTARNWLAEKCDPSGYAVARAESVFPGVAVFLTRDAA